MGNAYGTSFINNDESKIRTPILITYFTEKIKKAEDNIKNIDATRIKLQNEVTTKEAAFKTAENNFQSDSKDLSKQTIFLKAKDERDIANAELANLSLTRLTEELHKITEESLEWDIPEITTLFEETKKKYPLAPPTTSGASTASAGSTSTSSGSSSASAGASTRKGLPTNNNIDFAELQKYITNHPGSTSDEIKRLYNTAVKSKKGWLNDIKDYIRNNISTAESDKIFIDTIAPGTKMPKSLIGGARPSRKHRRTPERQSYRRPRARGIATRKNHRLRQGE